MKLIYSYSTLVGLYQLTSYIETESYSFEQSYA